MIIIIIIIMTIERYGWHGLLSAVATWRSIGKVHATQVYAQSP